MMATIGRWTVCLLISVAIVAAANGVAIYFESERTGTIAIGMVAGIFLAAAIKAVEALSEHTKNNVATS